MIKFKTIQFKTQFEIRIEYNLLSIEKSYKNIYMIYHLYKGRFLLCLILKETKITYLLTSKKIELVKEYQTDKYSFNELSTKFKISYSAARSICLGFDAEGDDFLKRKSGNKSNHTIHHSERSTSLDPKDREIAKLRKELANQKIETEILKKFQSLLKGNKPKK
ncbi:helix-turn-helix domain-containing protein [Mesoplasma seiffertii]|uniref:helix-turn-helix domain-containing protein n=1 Tax=Mesoplasma seiffertii TaxID=28224 RepID=UPI00047CA7BD